MASERSSFRVELRYAPLPFIGAIAVHYWFVVYDESGACHRWEVWQTQNAGGRSFGHVHCDLKSPKDGVGGGPSRVAATWQGDEASRIAAVLQEPERYPHCGRYRYWPGPNSNSFVAWVLAQAGIQYPLHWKGIGRKWR
ncbi:MAG: DUF3750 domain-containing protein [Burkholderiales bacterium]